MSDIDNLLAGIARQIESGDPIIREELIGAIRDVEAMLYEGTQLVRAHYSVTQESYLVKLSLEERGVLREYLEGTTWSGVGITIEDVALLTEAIDRAIKDTVQELVAVGSGNLGKEARVNPVGRLNILLALVYRLVNRGEEPPVKLHT